MILNGLGGHDPMLVIMKIKNDSVMRFCQYSRVSSFHSLYVFSVSKGTFNRFFT